MKNENDLGESKQLHMKETLTPFKSNDEQYINMEPNGVVFVQNVESSSDRDMDNQKRTLRFAYSLVQKKGISFHFIFIYPLQMCSEQIIYLRC